MSTALPAVTYRGAICGSVPRCGSVLQYDGPTQFTSELQLGRRISHSEFRVSFVALSSGDNQHGISIEWITQQHGREPEFSNRFDRKTTRLVRCGTLDL